MKNYSMDMIANGGKFYGSDNMILPGQLHLSSWPVISTLDNIRDHFVIWREINHPFVVVANKLMIVGYPHGINNVPDQHYYQVSNMLRKHPVFQEDPNYIEFIEKEVNNNLALNHLELLLALTIRRVINSLPNHIINRMKELHTDAYVWDELKQLEEKKKILFRKLQSKADEIFKEVITEMTINDLTDET